MNNWIAATLGLVEGLTEFLPVSSTGHLILVSSALGLENTAFLKLFEICIQSGAIFAVILIFWKDLLIDKTLLLKMSVAFLPTAVLGLLLHDIVKRYLFSPLIVCLALFFGGVILLIFEQFLSKRKTKTFSYRDYFLLGVIQCVAFIPGVSRSAATILGSRFLGSSREDAVKFSFLLAIPTILSASFYSLLKVDYQLNAGEINYLIVGIVSSFVFGFLSIKTFLKLLNHKTFIVCGIYRMVLAVIYFILIL